MKQEIISIREMNELLIRKKLEEMNRSTPTKKCTRKAVASRVSSSMVKCDKPYHKKTNTP